MRRIGCILALLFSGYLHAQDVQWASEVVRFSTEYGRKQYSAKQVLGAPDKLPAAGESAVAWAPSTPDNPNGEFIHVAFAVPQYVQQIGIGENNGPGAVREVILYDTNGKKYSVYRNDTIQPAYNTGSRIFRVFIPRTSYMVKELRVVLNTKAIAGMNQIDCIGIRDSEEPIRAVIREAEYAEILPATENLGPAVNSDADDMFPFISPDGKTLYFARKKHFQNTGPEMRDDIYVSKFDNGKWSTAVNIGEPLNNEQHNYVTWISGDGNSVLLANNYEKVKQDISISRKTGTGWSFPKALKINDFYNDNEFSCYHMNTEGNVILMAIERPDALGDMDIYVSFLQSNKVWTAPKNIGSTINTAATEGSIFLAADNKTIYFASNGHSGYGGYDMFMSRRLDDTWTNWSPPVNLGSKINSAGHDYYYTIPASGDYAYFSSTNNSYGKADLYRIPLPKPLQPEPVTLLKGRILDAETGKPIPADIAFGGLVSDEPDGITSTGDGNYQIIVPEDNYTVTITKPGYFPISTTIEPDLRYDDVDFNPEDSLAVIKHQITTDLRSDIRTQPLREKQLEEEVEKRLPTLPADSVAELRTALLRDLEETFTAKDSVYTEVTEDITMIPIREGMVIRLNNIYFEANKSDLKPESSAALDELVTFLNENPNIYVEIGGHTNGLPNDAFCAKLSNDRAQAVVEYLNAHGIPADHLTWKGYGKTLPIADNATLEGRRMNQRVELKVMRVE